jgi:hypothetical protein
MELFITLDYVLVHGYIYKDHIQQVKRMETLMVVL